jgi:hypothetical protein
MMMKAVRTSETSVDNHITRQYIPEDNSEHHTRRRENLKSHKSYKHTKQPDSIIYLRFIASVSNWQHHFAPEPEVQSEHFSLYRNFKYRKLFDFLSHLIQTCKPTLMPNHNPIKV